MRDLAGKAAFVTGGAGGIGLALARAFVDAGMRVMLADLDAPALEAAVAALGPAARGVVCDVADPLSVESAAQAAIAAFGRVHVVCNNAGISALGGAEAISLENWRWVTDVNLLGVVHGVRAFLPHIRAHGEGGHFVNTASMAGMLGAALGFSAYTATKFAVVGMSEGLAAELRPFGIGVSVLCPGWVRTNIVASVAKRPERYGDAPQPVPDSPRIARVAEYVRNGMDPADVAALVLAAIRADEFYIFTHADMRPALAERFAGIMSAYDKLG